ncbi:Beta-glucan synthesis-associated protein skn1, partial [Globisporangium polare]
YATVAASLKRGITDNKCSLTTCPGSHDVLADLGYIDGNASLGHWGVNEKGTCFPEMNAYQGVFLCDPDSQNPNCATPRNDTTAKINSMAPFDYQMDALSANWGVHVGVYTSFLTYQLEWVTGDEGYIRWMLHGNPIFEIPAETVINVGQDEIKSNPVRTFPEEPMYMVLNVALSAQWGAVPPNPGKPCRGDGEDAVTNKICDSFPMYMKIDYVRVYQDTSENSNMAVGCDPKTHPTRQWIQDYIDEYTDNDNQHIDVNGGARCRTSKDCTIPWSTQRQFQTGYCNSKNVCECSNQYWGGPRCTYQLEETSSNGSVALSSYG